MILEAESSNRGKLLSSPSSENKLDDVYVRAECSFADRSSKFRHKTRDFTKQFAHIYAVRLEKMRDILLNRIQLKWGSKYPIKKLIDLKEEDIDKCVIMGTLFKHQDLKPSILKEISEEHQLAPQPVRKYFVDEGDELILEDEQQRIHLIGKLNVHAVVTGVVCAVLGRDTGNGKFEVDDYCWPYVSTRITSHLSFNDNRFIILVSGLGLANNADSLLPLQMLTDWISGLLGDPGDQKMQSLVVRVIIAGNSVRDSAPHKTSTLSNTLKLDVESSLQATQQLDDVLYELVCSVDVDIMPGEHDPANHMLPQQPLHFCMFPRASSYETLHGATNPYECDIGGLRVLGTSGQPIQDIASYSVLNDPLDILRQTLEWGHLAPTCPDTLSGYPFYKEDPFIITECPDIYFAGNQAQFQSSLYEGPEGQKTRLVCIPSFAKTQTCVVVELNTLNCYPVSFGSGSYDSDTEK